MGGGAQKAVKAGQPPEKFFRGRPTVFSSRFYPNAGAATRITVRW